MSEEPSKRPRIEKTDDNALEYFRQSRIPKNTECGTKYAVDQFNHWREEHRKLGNRFAPLDCGLLAILNTSIPKFVVEIRKQNGEKYKWTSLNNIYFGMYLYNVKE